MVSSMTGTGSLAGGVAGVAVVAAETDAAASVAVVVAVAEDALEAARLISCTSLGSASSFVHRGVRCSWGAA
jgi:hypothetical protein